MLGQVLSGNITLGQDKPGYVRLSQVRWG